MATNRQKVLQLANTIGGRITDKSFFLSKQVKKYFEDKTLALTKRYDSKVRVPVNIKWEDPQITAFTDNRIIHINANCELMKGLTRPSKFLTMQGFLFHEIGHILYTDFKYSNMSFTETMKTGKLFPEPNIDATMLNDFLADGKYKNSFMMIQKNIWNILEDGYIEYRFLEEHEAPIFCDGLLALRNLFVNSFDSLSSMIKKEKDESYKLFTILNALLCYAKFGKLLFRNKKEQFDERMQAVISCVPNIDIVNNTYETEEHYKAINDVIVLLSPYIIEFLKTLPAETENSTASSGCGDSTSEKVKEALSSIEQNGGLIDTSNQSESPEKSNEEPLAKVGSEAGNNGSGHKPMGDVESDDVNERNKEIPKPSEESLERSMKETEKLLNSMAEENAEKELTKEHTQKLNDENKNIDYGEIHKGIYCDIVRETEIVPSAKAAWEKIAPMVTKTAKATSKQLKQILKDKRNGSVMRGLYFGKTISPVSYSRYDKKYFQNKKLPTNSPTLSICVLIDESGSMGGKKIEYAKIMALVVYLFCQELGIRLKVIGHSSSCETVELTTYTEYDGGFDKNDIYRLTQISAKCSNRDGYALKYCEESLKKETSDVKLLFVISDGAPAASGYHGGIAYLDIENVVKDSSRHHIDVIAAAIDEDKQDIKNIYGEDKFLDITNLDDLPKIITNCIKKYLPNC